MFFQMWIDIYLQELSLCHLALQLFQICFFLVMLILLHIHYSSHKQMGKKLLCWHYYFPAVISCGVALLSALILPCACKWFCKLVCWTGMMKYILSSCVPDMLRCLWVSYRYRVWRCYLHYHAVLYPSFQQDKLAGREFCAVPSKMVPLLRGCVLWRHPVLPLHRACFLQ